MDIALDSPVNIPPPSPTPSYSPRTPSLSRSPQSRPSIAQGRLSSSEQNPRSTHAMSTSQPSHLENRHVRSSTSVEENTSEQDLVAPRPADSELDLSVTAGGQSSELRQATEAERTTRNEATTQQEVNGNGNNIHASATSVSLQPEYPEALPSTSQSSESERDEANLGQSQPQGESEVSDSPPTSDSENMSSSAPTETSEPPPPPPPAPEADVPDWVDIVDDPSRPDEEELKEMEGTDANASALDVKYMESKFYHGSDDPEQVPKKKIRISWAIKGIRGTQGKPNYARVMNSPAAFVDGFYWHIKFYPRGNNASALSAYIKCSRTPPKPDAEVAESTFAYFQGPPDADFTEAKPEVEMDIPATPSNVKDLSVPKPEETRSGDDARKNENQTREERSANASEEAPKTQSGTVDEAEDWRISAEIGMVIYNPRETRTRYYMSSCHQFNKHNDDWGWTNYHGPWSEIHKRHRHEHQALLQNDTLALDAYIRIFDDPSQALWWHAAPDAEKQWDSVSLAGYRAMGTPPLYHSPGVAGITSWLLLAPFRKIVQNIDTGAFRKIPSAKQLPLLVKTQMVLYLMRKQRKDENYVNVNDMLCQLDNLGESHVDVFTFWEAFRRSLELEMKGHDAVQQISDIFDGHLCDGGDQERGTRIQIPVLGVSTIQEGLEKVLSPTSSKQVFPQFLPISLERQKFDTSTREWKLLYDRVKLSEEIDLSRWSNDASIAKYTLYGFVVHVGERASGKFYAVLRPDGPGAKWLAFEDGDGNKVFSYTRRKIEEFEGIEGAELRENNSNPRQTAYLAMYIRTDKLKDFLPGGLEPYHIPSWIKEQITTPCDPESRENSEGSEEPSTDVHLQFYSSTVAVGRAGLIDTDILKDPRMSADCPRRLAVPSETTFAEVRQKLAKWSDIDHVEKIRLWIMKPGPSGESVGLEKPRLHREVDSYATSGRAICLWVHVLETDEDVKLFGVPDPRPDADPFSKVVILSDIGSEADDRDPTPTAPANIDTVQQPDTTIEAVSVLPAEPATDLPAILSGSNGLATVATTSSTQTTTVSDTNAVPASSGNTTSPHPDFTEPSQVTETRLASDENSLNPEAQGDRTTDNVEHIAVDGPGRVENDLVESVPDGTDEETRPAASEVATAVSFVHNEPGPVHSVELPTGEVVEHNIPELLASTAQIGSTESTAVMDLVDELNAAAVAEASADRPTITTEMVANEVLIAALVQSDMQLIEGVETIPPIPVTTNDAVPSPDMPPVLAEPTATDNGGNEQNPANADTAEDARSESSSEEDEPHGPVPYVYGFIQIFDAEAQSFTTHGTFFAKETSIVVDTLRKALGYAGDRDILIWRRFSCYKLCTVAPNSSFEELNFRLDGFVLVVGDALTDSVQDSIRFKGNFANPELLSRYLWMSARGHPIHAFTGTKVVSDFGSPFFSGPFVKGLYHGSSAKHISSPGHTYTGSFVAGERHGDDGTMIYQNGDNYTGSWSKGERHGHGVFVEKRTGNRYEGGYQGGKRWGKGVTYWEVADEEGEMCQICYGEGMDALFYDCGHVCACVECAKQVDCCPICRKSVRHVVKMYKS